MSKQEIVDELHRPARRRYPRRQVRVLSINDLWEADLVDMQSMAGSNRNHKYLLTVINAFSKFGYGEPVKSKSGPDVTRAMEKILKTSAKPPKNLHVDRGKEFYNQHFLDLMKKYNINMYSTFSSMKATMVERYNRTLRTKMQKKFSLRGSKRWLDILPSLLDEYNKSVHRTTGFRPVDVKTKEHEATILKRLASIKVKKQQRVKRKHKFKVGDYVRISRLKHLFEKGYTANFSIEVFKIVGVRDTIPPVYLLSDLKGKPIAGTFYQEELSKTKNVDFYFVEKVLKRDKKTNRALVKWWGFDSTENSWIDINSIVK